MEYNLQERLDFTSIILNATMQDGSTHKNYEFEVQGFEFILGHEDGEDFPNKTRLIKLLSTPIETSTVQKNVNEEIGKIVRETISRELVLELTNFLDDEDSTYFSFADDNSVYAKEEFKQSSIEVVYKLHEKVQ